MSIAHNAERPRGVTFVDYKFMRKDDVIIMDKELTLEQLQINLGDALEVKQSDTGQVYFQIKESGVAV
tara:strand:+ start:20593 stop:20796 length:204 start_codon:yes stop_codon:yes gene_type:complete